MSTFDHHKVVDGFIRTMERNGAGRATQSNAFDKVKSVLLDAYRLGIYTENPLLGVKPPQYDPDRAVIPSPAQLRDIRTAGDDRFLLIADLMSGCGMRNGEAFAVNLNNLVAGDVYRITEQVNQTTKTYDLHTVPSAVVVNTDASRRQQHVRLDASGRAPGGTPTPRRPAGRRRWAAGRSGAGGRWR
ncbi:hypothetical protein [Streptomyces sp. NBC_01367]|uniref:hypothetical protein n=1 Tax=Streptomyces sp. NBC_01367 TaxID=2903841 RepID=UPI0032437E33